jgi:hypothetical protein
LEAWGWAPKLQTPWGAAMDWAGPQARMAHPTLPERGFLKAPYQGVQQAIKPFPHFLPASPATAPGLAHKPPAPSGRAAELLLPPLPGRPPRRARPCKPSPPPKLVAARRRSRRRRLNRPVFCGWRRCDRMYAEARHTATACLSRPWFWGASRRARAPPPHKGRHAHAPKLVRCVHGRRAAHPRSAGWGAGRQPTRTAPPCVWLLPRTLLPALAVHAHSCLYGQTAVAVERGGRCAVARCQRRG